MITESQFRQAENAVYEAEANLNSALATLSVEATRILGYEVTACYCAGNEIEFRTINEFGAIDADSCIRMEDVISTIRRRK